MTVDDVSRHVERLRSDDTLEKLDARSMLASLDANMVYEVLVSDQKRRQDRGADTALLAFGTLGLAFAMLLLLMATDWHWTGAAIFAPVVIFIGAQMTSLLKEIFKRSDPALSVEGLKFVRNPAAVDPLLAWLFVVSGRERALIMEGLSCAMPNLREGSEVLLYPAARSALNRIVTSRDREFDREFVLLSLDALGKVGDESAVPSLLKVIERPSTAPKIRDSAEAALDKIQERLAQMRQPATLLRPSGTADEEGLLRASSLSAGIDSDVLLRAAPPPEFVRLYKDRR